MRMAKGLFLSLLLLASPARGDGDDPTVMLITAQNGDEIAIASSEIVDVHLGSSQNFNQIMVELNVRKGKAFAELTRDNVGHIISIHVCGKKVVEPLILDAIPGGGLAMAGLEWDEAREVVEVLTGERSCGQ